MEPLVRDPAKGKTPLLEDVGERESHGLKPKDRLTLGEKYSRKRVKVVRPSNQYEKLHIKKN